MAYGNGYGGEGKKSKKNPSKKAYGNKMKKGGSMKKSKQYPHKKTEKYKKMAY
jgi:hypothetical protein